MINIILCDVPVEMPGEFDGVLRSHAMSQPFSIASDSSVHFPRLLSRSANVCAESAFGETPLDVAGDNIAEFCGSSARREHEDCTCEVKLLIPYINTLFRPI